MMSIGLSPGDEVITTNFTFVATVEVVALLGLKLILVDPDPFTYNISVEAVRKAIADGGLKGDARMEERFTAPHISEQQKKLQEFILRKDAVIFPEMKYLRRLILPGGVNQK